MYMTSHQGWHKPFFFFFFSFCRLEQIHNGTSLGPSTEMKRTTSSVLATKQCLLTYLRAADYFGGTRETVWDPQLCPVRKEEDSEEMAGMVVAVPVPAPAIICGLCLTLLNKRDGPVGHSISN